jgi:hypothetical protein
MSDGPWPTPDQELLLRAALLRDERGLGAWRQWAATHDLFGAYPDASDRLLPLVYRNLRALGADEPALGTLGGVHRYWWCSNQDLLPRLATVLDSLHAQGIPTLVLGAAATGSLYYEHLGVRPIDVGQVLVPGDRAPAAAEALRRRGWRGTGERVADALRYRPSARLVGDKGRPLELHGHALRGRLDARVDQEFWRRSVPLVVHRTATAGLAPGDALLYAIMQGVRGSVPPAIGWIADAMAILGSTEARIDWETLVAEARARRAELELGRSLDYLAGAFDAAIPERVRRRLRAAVPSRVERLARRYQTREPGNRRALARVAALGLEYLQLVEGRSLPAQLRALPGFLRFRLRGRARLGSAMQRDSGPGVRLRLPDDSPARRASTEAIASKAKSDPA